MYLIQLGLQVREINNKLKIVHRIPPRSLHGLQTLGVFVK